MAPFGISSGTVSLSGLLQQKAPSGSQCLQFSENPGQEELLNILLSSFLSQSLFTAQALIIASKLKDIPPVFLIKPGFLESGGRKEEHTKQLYQHQRL